MQPGSLSNFKALSYQKLCGEKGEFIYFNLSIDLAYQQLIFKAHFWFKVVSNKASYTM